MVNTIFLILFVVVFFPFVLMNFNNIRKGQKEILDQLRETNRLLAEMIEKNQ